MIVVRLIMTALIVIAAVTGAIVVWDNVFSDPWTRDAHVRADIVEVAPQVSGPITDLTVANNTHVKEGDPLFTIERTDYQLALDEAAASLEQAEAQLALKRQSSERYTALKQRNSSAVSDNDVVTAELETKAAAAAVKSARVALSRAKTNLDRTSVFAPASGQITNLNADTGDFASAGKAVLAIVDENSFRIDAFFMETKLPFIRQGDDARIKLMASGETITGTVRGISTGIAYDQDDSSALLQNPTPSFQWIRLAQRIPVEIAIGEKPSQTPLINGATASVIVELADDRKQDPWWQRVVSALR